MINVKILKIVTPVVTVSKVQKNICGFLSAVRTMKKLNLNRVVSSLTGVVEAAGLSMERERGQLGVIIFSCFLMR